MRKAKEKQDEVEEPIGLNLLVEKEDEQTIEKKVVKQKIKYNYKWLQQYEIEKQKKLEHELKLER